MAHTPAPWLSKRLFGDRGWAVFWTDTSKPGKWQRRVDDAHGELKEEDARLMAAAPKLLEALEMARDNVSHGQTCAARLHSANECTCYVADLDSAIAKARR